uniref:Uncharacterized protein n=1 Tax=Glossina morsitans morsitans TaxID=37546 RepID=A0A1B0G112_GLOMM
MKRFTCFNLRSISYTAAAVDIILSCLIWCLCSLYLYHDYYRMTSWSSGRDNVIINKSFNNFLSTVVNYVLLHNFPDAFYVVMSIILWIKSLTNFVLAAVLIDGIKRKRTICIAPWLINTIISIIVEVTVYIFMELKFNETDATLDKRIVRSIMFGIFIMFNLMFTFAIFCLCKILKIQQEEARELQESIVETTGIFQHVK